jgi:septation ring formation regulator EzrA
MTSKKPAERSQTPGEYETLIAILSEQAQLLSQLTETVTQGFSDTTNAIMDVEETLDMHAVAAAGDHSDLVERLSAIENDTAHSRSDLAVTKDTVSGSERRLGTIERSLDALNRRTEADVQDLLRRVSALEAVASA